MHYKFGTQRFVSDKLDGIIYFSLKDWNPRKFVIGYVFLNFDNSANCFNNISNE